MKHLSTVLRVFDAIATAVAVVLGLTPDPTLAVVEAQHPIDRRHQIDRRHHTV
ncbi:MAG: hypothetical protein ACR2JC_05655 [Chloroflexota bacterium]